MRYRDYVRTHDFLPAPNEPGAMNRISDVPGILVGHHTVKQDEPTFLRTGVTAITIDDVMERPVAAASHVFNGYGKSLGLIQVEELGTIESPLYFTNTLSIGAIHQGAVRVAQRARPALRTFNPIVFECNDGVISDIGSLAVTEPMAALAHDNASREFALGSVGAGTGMICFGCKGGIGSASRRITIAGQEFHVGALVLTNFGRREDLRLPGISRAFAQGPESGAGSLIMVVATDLPLMPHQLKRVARHMSQAIGVLGAPGHHGSGDIALAFSTATRLTKAPTLQSREVIGDEGEVMSTIFRAAVWSTAEAILDSMFESPTMIGRDGEVKGILEAMG